MLKRKKIFWQCMLMGGASYPYPGIPTKGQEDGLKPTKSIKNTPQGTEKVLLTERQLCTNTEETDGHFHTGYIETDMLSIRTLEQSGIWLYQGSMSVNRLTVTTPHFLLIFQGSNPE